MGVIDPAKVTRLALQNAGSIAGLILTTDCLIASVPSAAASMSGAGGARVLKRVDCLAMPAVSAQPNPRPLPDDALAQPAGAHRAACAAR